LPRYASYSLEEAGGEELVLLLVGGCDDACGTDYEHAHGAVIRIFFEKNHPEGDGSAGVNLFMSLGKGYS
jgi:hypothetical protein